MIVIIVWYSDTGYYWWFQDLDPQSCTSHTQIADRRCPSDGKDVRKAWTLTIMVNIFGECQAPAWQLLTAIVDFGKDYTP